MVGLGVWIFRRRIGQAANGSETPARMTDRPIFESILFVFHIWMLLAWNFQSIDFVDMFADLAVPAIILPTIAVMTGRYWPFLVSMPIVLLPIAGKTLRQMCYRLPPELATPEQAGWILFIAVPLLITTTMAIYFAVRSKTNESSWPSVGR